MDALLGVVIAVIVIAAVVWFLRGAFKRSAPLNAPTLHAPGPDEVSPPDETSPAVSPPPPSIPPPVTAPTEPQTPNTTERGIPQELLDLLQEEQESHDGEPVGIGADDRPTDESDVTSQTGPIEFSAYYPKEVAPKVWQPLLAYVFRETADAAVSADAAQQLGDKLAQFRQTTEPARLAVREGATIKAEPLLDGFQFNPPSVSIGLFEDWHRFDFKMRADSAPLDLAANGRLTFTVEGIIVADLPLSVFVGASPSASQTATPRAKPYDAVFCSYSRKDMLIVERVERAYKALGMTYMRDMISIRSGEDWSEALKTLIEQADIFQLFWSSHSSISDHVKMEWDYALALAPTRDHFIRPVYWETPMPAVPEALGKLHFAFEPDLGA